MLDVHLDAETERGLENLARRSGQPKNEIAREAIRQYVAKSDAKARAAVIEQTGDDATGAWLRCLDAEDGGYDWGPNGPPAGA